MFNGTFSTDYIVQSEYEIYCVRSGDKTHTTKQYTEPKKS